MRTRVLTFFWIVFAFANINLVCLGTLTVFTDFLEIALVIAEKRLSLIFRI
jgi:hypothetical protein